MQTAELPYHHRDPFDRLLIAQAMVLDIPIMTADPAFDPYAIEVIPSYQPVVEPGVERQAPATGARCNWQRQHGRARYPTARRAARLVV